MAYLSYEDFLLNEQYINEMYGEIYEKFDMSKFKDVLKNIKNDIISNFKFVTTFGTSIALFYPIVENLIYNSKLEVTPSPTNIVLLTIGGISMIIDNNKDKLNIITSKLGEGSWADIMLKIKKMFLNITDIFVIVLKEFGKTIRGFSDMLAYTFLLVPFMTELMKFINTNNLDLMDFEKIMISTASGTAIIAGKNIIDYIINNIDTKKLKLA